MNILIAILVVAALVAFYWVFWRALPQTSGRIETYVTQPVEVRRDERGVPHIRARNLQDAWFAQGYVTASERMFQMDGLRRLAGGDLAEIVGRPALESDREARRLRLRRTAEEAYARLSADDRADVNAYARGVNAYIESHRGRYGLEFTLLGYDPRPWTGVDSLLAGLQMFRTLTNQWPNKLLKGQMRSAGDPEKVDFLFPFRAGAEILPGGDAQPGSNAWAIAGSRSASGKPLLSNDMHLEYSIPGIWFEVHIEAPGLDVVGVALPGLPGVVSGHNDRIAWGMTNLGFSVQDLYVERIDVRTGQYLYQGKPEQARQEREIIRVKGLPAEEMVLWVTRHGPIIDAGRGGGLALRWAAYEPDVLQNVFPQLDRARNWSEFNQALARFGGPGQNFVYADADGNIGYHATGKLPIRRNYYGDVPVDGSSGEFEWEGYIPFDQLPHAFNPKGGIIVTANQDPFPPGYPYHVSGNFEAPYRSQQISDMLHARGAGITPSDTLGIQKDVYSELNHFIAKQTAVAYGGHQGSKGAMDDAIAMLRAWNGQMDLERPEPLITTLIYQNIRRSVAERAAPGFGDKYAPAISSSVVERLLRERPAGWFSDYDQLVLRSFTDAMDEAQRRQGSNPRLWRWGRYMFLAINHPLGSRLPLVSGFFDIGPVPMSGGAVTVKQTTPRLGPSERINSVAGDWDASLMNLPIGESGHVASLHYKDQWDAYYNGTSFPMPFRNVHATSTVTFVPKR